MKSHHAQLMFMFCLGGFLPYLLANRQGEPPTSGRTLPIFWQQHSAEYRALCYQAFNLAEIRLEEIASTPRGSKPRAIITDLDETILDNSYMYAQQIHKGPEGNWPDWKKKSAATAVPGAVNFLWSARKKGFRIFYVSNRTTDEQASTLKNLQKLNLPDADAEHMRLQATTSSKEKRRNDITSAYDVVLLLGDNLADFMDVFDSNDNCGRKKEVDKMRSKWGRTFIVLPDTIYGTWTNGYSDSELIDYKKLDKGDVKCNL